VLFPASIGEVRSIGSLDGPPPVSLPSLTNRKFKFAAPERNLGFDGTDWTIADHTTTNNPIQVPIPPKPGKYQLTAIAGYRQGGEQDRRHGYGGSGSASPFHRGP
jgi:hypothetical protein